MRTKSRDYPSPIVAPATCCCSGEERRVVVVVAEPDGGGGGGRTVRRGEWWWWRQNLTVVVVVAPATLPLLRRAFPCSGEPSPSPASLLLLRRAFSCSVFSLVSFFPSFFCFNCGGERNGEREVVLEYMRKGKGLFGHFT